MVTELAREHPLASLFVVAAASVWLVVAGLLAVGVSGPGALRAFIRVVALAVVLSGFAVWFGRQPLARRLG